MGVVQVSGPCGVHYTSKFLRKGVAAVIATVNETSTRPNNPITLVVGKIQEEAAVNIQYIILNHLHNDDSEP